MAAGLRVTLAGRVGLEVDGVAVDTAGLGRPGRSALAYLTCHRHRPVSRDELAELLWAEELPQSWEQMLRGVIFKLRRVLSSAGLDATAILTTTAGLYRLELPPGAAVDVEEAAASLEAAEAALAAGYAAAAEVKAQEVLEITARQFAADAAGVWVEQRQADLREVRLRALDVLARASLAEGRWDAAVTAAEQALSVEPYRESAYVRLMEAHAGRGSRGEALRAYEQCRRMLVEQLGVGPAAPTEAAYVRLLGDEEDSPDTVPATSTQLPLPAALSPSPGRLFVGRDAESQRLAAALERVEIEGRQAVLIGGEPGAGKTTLVAQVARTAHAGGARVLYGRCDEELGVAYQPFAEALSHYVNTCPLAELHAHGATWGDELARLAPALTRRLPEAPSHKPPPTEDDRWRLFEAVTDLLRHASSSAPLILILDDLHWAATPTLLLLRHLLTSSSPTALLLVATYRPTDVGPRHPLQATLADLRRVPGIERLALAGLDQGEVEAFVQATGAFAGQDVHSLARSLHARTAGNPFFVEEMLRHFSEAGAPGPASESPGQEDDDPGARVPEGVVDVVLRRVHRLSAQANDALRLGSVIGTEFDVGVLEQAIGPGADRVLDAVEEALGAHLVEEGDRPGRYRFAHAVVRQALYGELGRARRARMHRDVGEGLESMHAEGRVVELPALAHHYAEAASTGCGTKAADYAVAAARQAIDDTAWEQAVVLIERGMRALALCPGDERTRQLELRLTLGEAQRRAGLPQHRVTLIEAARLAQELGDVDRLAQAALANNRGYCSVSWAVDTDRVDVLQAALAAVGPADRPARARLLANLAAETLYVGSPEPSRRLSDEALAMARRLDDPETIAAVLTPRFNTIRGDPATLSERVANAGEFIAAAERTGDPVVKTLAWGWRAVTAVERADPEEVDQCFGLWEELDAHVRQPTLRWYLTYSRAALLLFRGRAGEADRLSREALGLGKAAGHPDARTVFDSQQFQLRFELGRIERLDRSMRQSMARESPEVPRDQVLHVRRACLALVYRALDRRQEAADVFEELAGSGFSDIARFPTWLYTIAGCADVCAYLSNAERAATLFGLMSPFADQIVTLSSLVYSGSVCHYLGMLAATLGRRVDAEEFFAEAAAIHTRMDASGWLARTRLEWARLLLQGTARDASRARELLRQAVVTASSFGLAVVGREAESLLRSRPTLNRDQRVG